MSLSSHLHAVILAGGAGARFWPLSRELDPKQLLSIFGTESLIVQAVQRITPFLGPRPAPVQIVTNERLVGPLSAHLSEQAQSLACVCEFLVEPVGRNTAPALALVAACLAARDPGAILFVLPSDHVMQADAAWADTVRTAVGLAEAGYLATVGIPPTRPETGFGYIELGDTLPELQAGRVCPHRARRFIEKPDLPRAEALLAAGGVCWNAGIFCFRADLLLEEMAEASPEGALIVDTCRQLAMLPPARWLDDSYRLAFAALPPVSIDVAVFERSSRVAVAPVSLAWSDVGSLLALETLGTPDARGNVRIGRGVDIDSRDVTVYTGERLVATLGMADTLVVDTRDATLICPKSRCQDVRAVVQALQAIGAAELAEPCAQVRRWGSWTTLLRGERFQVKLVKMHPFARTATQRHHQRSEHWVVLEGTAVVWRGDEVLTVGAEEDVRIPPGVPHVLLNGGASPLSVIEIQVGDDLSDGDTERLPAPMEVELCPSMP